VFGRPAVNIFSLRYDGRVLPATFAETGSPREYLPPMAGLVDDRKHRALVRGRGMRERDRPLMVVTKVV
jgi:hypothetical protein